MTDIPAGAPHVYVVFSAEVNPTTTESLLAAMANCANAHVKEVTLLISTNGGSVMHGMNLYNVLVGMPFRLTTHNVGNVDSIGNAIFLAGSPRYSCPGATFMFHGVAFKGDGMLLDERLTRERLDGLQADKKRIGDVVTLRTKMESTFVEGMFSEGKTLHAADAVGFGIVDEIRDVQIAPGAPVLSLVFQR